MTAKKSTNAGSQSTHHGPDTKDELVMEADANSWANATARKPRSSREAAATEPHLPTSVVPPRTRISLKKPPAILIRPADGKSYSDTVHNISGHSGILEGS
ncbi:hypothetical protein ACI65C_001739 [Semiaphis heraclei]